MWPKRGTLRLEVRAAVVDSARKRRCSEGICAGIPEEPPGFEPRESAGIVGENASVVRGSVQVQRGE